MHYAAAKERAYDVNDQCLRCSKAFLYTCGRIGAIGHVPGLFDSCMQPVTWVRSAIIVGRSSLDAWRATQCADFAPCIGCSTTCAIATQRRCSCRCSQCTPQVTNNVTQDAVGHRSNSCHLPGNTARRIGRPVTLCSAQRPVTAA
jgi:hypothetical protein